MMIYRCRCTYIRTFPESFVSLDFSVLRQIQCSNSPATFHPLSPSTSSSHSQMKQFLLIFKMFVHSLRVSRCYQQLVVFHLKPILEHSYLALDIHSCHLKSFLNNVKGRNPRFSPSSQPNQLVCQVLVLHVSFG